MGLVAVRESETDHLKVSNSTTGNGRFQKTSSYNYFLGLFSVPKNN